MKTYKKVGIFALPLIFVLVSLFANAPNTSNPKMVLTNAPASTNQPFVFPSPPSSVMPHPLPTEVQVIRSLLGLEVKFLNGNVNYAGLMIANDPRYQALKTPEKLVDAILFQPVQTPPFLLLMAIAKNPNGAPTIIPGKFDVVRKTEQNGFVLKDAHGRLFYYSGYILATPAWKNLAPGQILQDKFCKESVQMTMCSPQNTVNVILKKPPDPRKDIPLLVLVK